MKKINFFMLTALIISLSLIGVISALENDLYNCPMSGFNGSFGGGIQILSWIIYLLIIILIIAAIYWLIKSANKTNGGVTK